MLGLFATLTEAVFVYLCICVFAFGYLHIRHLGTLFLRSSYHYLFKNIAHVWWSIWNFVFRHVWKVRVLSKDWRSKSLPMNGSPVSMITSTQSSPFTFFKHIFTKKICTCEEKPENWYFLGESCFHIPWVWGWTIWDGGKMDGTISENHHDVSHLISVRSECGRP